MCSLKVSSLLKGWFVVGVSGFVAFVVWFLYEFGHRWEEPPRDSTMSLVWFGWLFTWIWVLSVLCLVWCMVELYGWWVRRRKPKVLV